MPGKYYLKEQTADPGTGDPSSGNGVLYFKADGKIYFKNYNGDIFDLNLLFRSGQETVDSKEVPDTSTLPRGCIQEEVRLEQIHFLFFI
ncbi:hypothetical protein B6U74_06290 [Candidatus Bathyarchaeota archaeon ex4484_205]|nr:MAG: hypothetical protein B6U74_06290 [Candidatus Bathyarchaeota archaeon ex4484_205]